MAVVALVLLVHGMAIQVAALVVTTAAVRAALVVEAKVPTMETVEDVSTLKGKEYMNMLKPEAAADSMQVVLEVLAPAVRAVEVLVCCFLKKSRSKIH